MFASGDDSRCRCAAPPPAAAPTVSVVVPCRNERHHIEMCVRSILGQDPPSGGFEIIVVDGMSDDGTRAILGQLAAEDTRLRIADNPRAITPCAMNIGIRDARGRYIAIMGAHTEYASDYLRMCVELLDQHPEASCVGGPIVSKGRTLFGRASALAMSHPIGVGNAKHRFPHYEGYAEGACFPVFRREVFNRIGLYDETLVRNQDDELNYRLARHGEKVFISPRVRSSYYVRDAAFPLFRQYFQYGYWRVAVLTKHRRPASLRQVVPATFFAVMLLLLPAVLHPSAPAKALGLALPLTYVSALMAAGVVVATKHGARVGMMFAIAAGIMHTAYAAGFGRAILKRVGTAIGCRRRLRQESSHPAGEF